MEEKDYKKLYEDVVALAKDGLKDGLYLSQSAKAVTEFLFPQLKETEDEKIRRELTKFLINFNNGYYSKPSETEIDSWIKWIKKQSEQKTEIKYVYPKFRIGDVIEPIKPNGFYQPVRVLSIEEKTKSYYCESDDKKSFSSIPIRCENEYKLVEQKPSWSEEDERHRKRIIERLEDIRKSKEDNIDVVSVILSEINWLKSIKPQPKYKWTDEDEKNLKDLLAYGETKLGLRRWIAGLPEKLGSRSEYHWKPSEEQMEALFEAKLASIKNREYYLGLLYEDLKKL